MRPWVSFKLYVLAAFLSQHFLRGREVQALLLLMGQEVQVPHSTSIDTQSEGGTSLVGGVGGQLLLASPISVWKGQECLITVLQMAPVDITGGKVASLSVVEIQAPRLAFAGVSQSGSHSFCCSICLEQSNDCLEVFCLARLPFSGLLATKSMLLFELFVFVLRLSASSVPRLGYMRQKKTQGTHYCVGPWVPRSLASLPYSLLQFSLFLLYKMSGNFSCT